MERKELIFFDKKEMERFEKECLSTGSIYDITIDEFSYGEEDPYYIISWIQ